LRARGEEAEPAERFFRDSRINTIFEGSSEIMRLFIAREALDPHLKIAGAIFDGRLSLSKRLGAAARAGMFYAGWYPRLFARPLPKVRNRKFNIHPRLRPHLRFIERHSRKLARKLFHAMVHFGPKLEHEQLLLGRCVDIAAELFAMTASCARAAALKEEQSLWLTDYFCRTARLRIAALFRELHCNEDHRGYQLAQELLLKP
jgi:hypothetical protein